MIKGVKRAVVKRVGDTGIAHSKNEDAVVLKRLEAFDKLAGSISLSNIDLSDDRTNYILSK